MDWTRFGITKAQKPYMDVLCVCDSADMVRELCDKLTPMAIEHPEHFPESFLDFFRHMRDRRLKALGAGEVVG